MPHNTLRCNVPFNETDLVNRIIDELLKHMGFSLAVEIAETLYKFIDDATSPSDVVGFDLRVAFPGEEGEPPPSELAVTSLTNGYNVRRIQSKQSDLTYSVGGWRIGAALCSDVMCSDEYTAVIAVRRS